MCTKINKKRKERDVRSSFIYFTIKEEVYYYVYCIHYKAKKVVIIPPNRGDSPKVSLPLYL